jgi:hypothetical protein
MALMLRALKSHGKTFAFDALEEKAGAGEGQFNRRQTLAW